MHWIDPEIQKGLDKKVNLWRTGRASLSDEDDDSLLFPFGRVKLKRFDPKDVSREDDEVTPTELLSLRSISNNVVKAEVKVTEDDRVLALFAAAEAESSKASVKADEAPKASSSASASSKGGTWDRNYLLNLIGNQDIMEALIQIINSTKSNDEIQDQLFDLLGFEKLDVISNVLKNRATIMKNINREEALALAVRNQVLSSSTSNAHPVIGVKIQSAEDKFLEKMYRKEDRKAMKAGGGGFLASGNVTQAEIDAGSSILNKIQASSVRFNGSDTPRVDYPNVYDSYAEAKQKAGFISGQKVSLPENMARKVTQEYEEVDIPPEAKTVPLSAASKPLLKISSLDPMAQEVFRGMTALNRIQTLVFETAYKTNENLLICAPTGAGKTNIALLAVLHCIKSNMEGGMIKKDQFKVKWEIM
jgi:activating signal cointegrator complex subunit 3